MAAFSAEEASSSLSSSSSPIPPKWVYDVFLSFSGVDTRKNFTAHLFASLGRHGFRTFRDDKELIRGEYVSDGLLKAIEESRISVIVFSKKYAESRWCLDELVKIMDCKKNLKQIVLPIFYDIDPSDVRGQKGSLEVAFSNHKERFKEDSDGKVQKWREALTDAADLSGWDSPNVANGDEAELLKIIIEEVGKKIDRTFLDVPDHQVGLESRLQKLNILLGMESNDVRIVGIWGIGGIGKTTIAKEMYNRIQCKFESSCFLADVRETSNKPNGIVVLQEQLLSDIFRNEAPNIRNVPHGTAIIKQRALCRKALIILDDADDDKQLKALAIGRECFSSGSRIIITTRNRSLLYTLGVNDNEIYAPKELHKNESLELFSWHAFKKDHPIQEYLALSDQVMHFAGGNPLALEVLGSMLYRREKAYWITAIAKLRKIPDFKVQVILKISFDSLSDEGKELFLDIACFFVGMDRDFTIKILEGRITSAAYEIGVLADRCLIKSGQSHNQLTMHDLIRDMGREIIRQESPEPGRRSRLWNHEDVLKIMRDGTGTKKVKGLLQSVPWSNDDKIFGKTNRLLYDENVLEVWRDGMGTNAVEGRLPNVPGPKLLQVNGKAFDGMNGLWLLHLKYVHVTGGYEHISKSLLWLCSHGFPLDCVPSNLSMDYLVALDLCYSSFKQVWKGIKVLSKLKFLYLSHCYNLTKTPNFSGLSNLEELFLNDCGSLVKVHESIRCLNKLIVLDMKNCKKLQKLPLDIFMLKCLESLDLSGCSNLGKLAGFRGSPSKSLRSFLSPWTLRTKNVDSIGSSLASVQSLSCLKKLKMANCNLSHLPSEIGRFISLEVLDLLGNNLRTLPDNICFLTRLKKLVLSSCNLSHLPNEIGSMISLEQLYLRNNNIRTLPDSICKQSCLKHLDLRDCSVSHFPTEIGKLCSLEYLSLEGNSSLTLLDSVCDLSSLRTLDLVRCDLSHLPSGIGRLSSLNSLYLDRNNFGTFPDSIWKLTGLGRLDLRGCNLSQLPSEIGRLSSLHWLELGENNFRTLTDGIGNLTRLWLLDLRDCARLQSLPKLPQSVLSIDCDGCHELAENNIVNNVRKNLHQNKRLLSPRGSTFFQMVLPGRCDVLTGFQYQSIGSSLSFKVPPLVNQKIFGWILCVFFEGPEDGSWPCVSLEEIICNKTIKKFRMGYSQYCRYSSLGSMLLAYLPLSNFQLQLEGGDELQLEGGDEVEIRIQSHSTVRVKMLGLDLMYEEVDESTKETNDEKALIQYGSSSDLDVILEEEEVG